MFKKILFTVFLSLSLSGCVAGVFAVGGAAATGSVTADNRTLETIGQDQKINFLAEQKLAANQDISNQAHISVTSYNRVVLLVGQAPTEDLRNQAVDLVKSVPNVRRIFNEITIEKPTSALRRSKDAAITANLRARFLATTNLKSNQIKVVTEDGVVYLMGLTTPEQADIAAQVARQSSGVKQVVKLVEYIYITTNTTEPTNS